MSSCSLKLGFSGLDFLQTLLIWAEWSSSFSSCEETCFISLKSINPPDVQSHLEKFQQWWEVWALGWRGKGKVSGVSQIWFLTLFRLCGHGQVPSLLCIYFFTWQMGRHYITIYMWSLQKTLQFVMQVQHVLSLILRIIITPPPFLWPDKAIERTLCYNNAYKTTSTYYPVYPKIR